MKHKILKFLKANTDKFVSGEQLSLKLGVTRSAVWKYISILRDEGYEIKSYPRKGYKLTSTPDILSSEEVREYLFTNIIGREIIYKDTVSSTNIIAKEVANKGYKEGTVLIANEQTNGKGRMGRSWDSLPNVGIWMSIILRPDIPPNQAPFITILAALAVMRALKNIDTFSPQIKWPNDIILNNKKVCGILTEMSTEIDRINYVVVGIGINVNTDILDLSEEIKDKATSIKIAAGHSVNRKKLTADILNNFEDIYLSAKSLEGRKKLIDEYKKYSITLGSEVKAFRGNEEIIGKAIKITDNGELIIETNEGKRCTIFSGEVTLRTAKNGYV